MMSIINAAKSIFTDNLTINHTFTGNYQDFVAEGYPAICLEADSDSARLHGGLSWKYDDTGAINVYYVEESPTDRDMTDFINKVDQIKELLKNYPQLSGVINEGISIRIQYLRRSSEDNIEFIAKITIEGRNV